MKLSASKFAKQAGVSTPTISRAIERGEVTAEKNPKGGYLIDASELDRFLANRKANSNDTPKTLGDTTPNENSVLQREIEMLREMLNETREDRDSWKKQAQKITALLEDKTEKPEKPTGWFDKLLGR